MNIKATAKQIMSAVQSDAFNEEACVKIIHAAQPQRSEIVPAGSVEGKFHSQFDMGEQAEELWRQRYNDVWQQLLSALAAIENTKTLLKDISRNAVAQEIIEQLEHYDLSALREHDAEVREPLVDALRCVQLMFERSDASDNFLGDDEQEAWTAVNDALAKVE